MRFSNIMQLAKEYMTLGVIVSFFIISILLISYLFIYKKVLKGKKTISHKSAIAGGILIFYYVIVLGATVFSRHAVYHHAMVLQIFATYREAWNEWNVIELRNLVWNVLMFVPIGFFFPYIGKICKKSWCTYLFSFLLTLCIEILQFFTGRGIFETDDLFNNFMGAAIGYGLYQMVRFVARIVKRRNLIWKSMMFSQIPLLCMIILFSGIFWAYEKQPYGNLKENYTYKVNMKHTEIISNLEFSSERKKKNIYQIEYVKEEDTYQMAQKFFQWVGSTVDEAKTRIYHDAVVYQTRDGQKSLEIQYQGGMMKYMNYGIIEDYELDSVNITYEKVKEDVEKFDLYVPEDGVLIQETDGWYSIDVYSRVVEDKMYGGKIRCNYTQDGRMKELQYQVLSSVEKDQIEIISQEEAFDCISQGKFVSPCSEPIDKLEILAVEEQSILDTKGFFQPVYQFTVKYNEGEGTITIPGMVEK